MPESPFHSSIPEAVVSESFLGMIQSALGIRPLAPLRLYKIAAKASHHQVWQVSHVESTKAYLKIYGNHLAYEREIAFYQAHSTALAKEIPQLLASGQKHLLDGKNPYPYILIKALNCPPFSAQAQLHKPKEAFKLAGSLLARIHRLPQEQKDTLPIHTALHLRTEHCLNKYSTILNTQDKKIILQLKNEIAVAADTKRVLCHRDYQANNWHYAAGQFQVLDFEHSRADYYLQDFSKIAFSIEAALFECFLSAYGITLSASEQSELKLLCWQHALTSMDWAKKNSSKSLLGEAEEIISRLRSESRR